MPIILSKLDGKIASSAAKSSTQLKEGNKKYEHVFNLSYLWNIYKFKGIR